MAGKDTVEAFLEIIYICRLCITFFPAPQVLDLVAISLNKNSVPGDKSAVVPGGVRIGSPALTTRGFVESDFVHVADFFDRRAPWLLARLASTCVTPANFS